MGTYRDNAKWLLRFSPFRSLSISAAYVMPFFLEHGLSTMQIFLLQSIFSAAYLLWEVPSGMIADRFGRAFSMKLSVPIMAVTMVAYGLSEEYWQFVICELIWALANGLLSGVDTALLYDSLKADGQEKKFVKLSQRIKALSYASIAVAVPLAMVLVHFWGTGSTLVADGIVTALGWFFVIRLTEAPHTKANKDEEANPVTAWVAARRLLSNPASRWLIVLRTTLSTATYMGFWLSAVYYTKLGIPVVLFGAILAVRSLWKTWLSHAVHHTQRVERTMMRYAILSGLVYLGMATGQIWLVWVVLGHDAVQALADSPLIKRINGHIVEEHRAMLNSVVNLVLRLVYTVAGPLVGLAVDKLGLSAGLVLTGLVGSCAAVFALWRLRAAKAVLV